MQSATQATLADLVEQHVTSLIRESATVNRHSNRGGLISAGNDEVDDGVAGRGGGSSGRRSHQKRRRLIHHDDVNMALSWRGSEKLYVSGVPVVAPCVTPTESDGEGSKNSNSNGSLGRLLKNTNSQTTVPSLLKSSSVPRVDLNAYLQSELAVRPPCELGMTLHWLAVDGVSPMIPMNDVWNNANGLPSGGIAPVLDLDEDHNGGKGGSPTDDKNNEDSSIRIRELQHRLISEELQLYYARVTSTIENSADVVEVTAVLHGIRTDVGIQELVPFLSRFVASGLMAKKNLHKTEYCRRLIKVFDAMLDNRSLHLDLHLHQMFTPVGTCIVAKKLSSSPHEDHWSLREEAAQCLVKACDIYGDQYTTMKPRIIKLLTQQALRVDRPLATQYGGIVGISLFGPRAVDAFLLPLVQEYWERWEEELQRMTNRADIGHVSKGKNVGREYELNMCQQALLNAMQVFMQNVTPGEQAKRVDIGTFTDVFGERLIPMLPEVTDYMAAVL
mmetsp:Transcript_4630/g.11661  ORF Transcript_4630/g.11661 Transcript_4630/m.11661 type:complete len:502 (-) Transcript_4630:136-1641(-)|eukprot:CAMPEP_0181088318 /NCGR_PEP_ID=MMETSP1071-20121207/6723_1 /TAXON_ID=35127 /ORGANISM="Thalassiosira sp., Strain NH16" /LENGTH=501 /DNA_ID=CAMNT_0023170227 /DNA_START=56 /DNA_END=1561 /DNA_ORIENTATION=+